MTHSYNLKLLFISIPLFILLNGCNNILTKKLEVKTNIEDFSLNQSNEKGNVFLKLVSPEAIINPITKNVQAKQTNITFFNEDNYPLYNLQANNSFITNEVKEIILLGNVILKRLEEETLTMYSDKLKWNSEKDIILFTGNVQGVMKTSSIRSEEAIYNIAEQTMIFNELKEYIVKTDNNTNKVLEVTANQAIWNGKTGKLNFNSNKNSVRSQIMIPIINKR